MAILQSAMARPANLGCPQMGSTGDTSGISRRAALAGAAGGVLAGLGAPGSAAAGRTTGSATVVPFHGGHQAGIVTPQQEFMYAAAFDVTATRRSELRDLLRAWSAAAARMTEG